MRICDWSSDVCSSDIVERLAPVAGFGNLEIKRFEDVASDLSNNLRIVDHETSLHVNAPCCDPWADLCPHSVIFPLIASAPVRRPRQGRGPARDRKSTRLNSSH